jgi:Putative metallopeptidase
MRVALSPNVLLTKFSLVQIFTRPMQRQANPTVWTRVLAMRRVFHPATTASTIACSILCVAPVKAETSPIPPNPRVEISYVVPTTPKFTTIYTRLKNRKVLETLQRFLAPLELPKDRKLVIRAAECGGKPQAPVTICYEYIEQIERLAPRSSVALVQGEVTREEAINGPVVQALLHDVALAVFDVLDVPVWGRKDDAADRVAAFVMVQFGPEVAWNAVVGTAWFLAANTTGRPSFSDVRKAVAQRYYTTLCIAMGAELRHVTGAEWGKQHSFASFLKTAAGSLPTTRARSCPSEYDLVKQSFDALIVPHLNRELLDQVRKAKWVSFGK